MKTKDLISKYIHYFSLEKEIEDHDRVYEEIHKSVVFKGTNLWILIFAIIVASVGLNMNSTAVIIGAMLISPLMGPINGMGYSIATYDIELFKKSINNFSFAIIVSLFASTTYFALSPISTAHSELLARTSPTIYDVLVALFGGLAGIVAISSKQKGNVIPGVAIATALMPPLCTAGYGLATAQFNFFFGAFYLFTINTIFIALAAVWVSQLLKFPIRSIVDPSRKRRINSMITFIITIVLLPSIFFGYKLVQQENFLHNAKVYVASLSSYEGNYLLRYDINQKTKVITLVYGGSGLSDEQKNEIVERANHFDISDASITIKQGLTFRGLNDASSEAFELKEQIIMLNQIVNQKNQIIDSLNTHRKFGREIYSEISSFYPQITKILFSEALDFVDSTNLKNVPLVVIYSNDPISQNDQLKINEWLERRTRNESVKVFYEIIEKPN